MRLVGRAAAAAVAALVAGLVVSFLAASWLRSATPEAGLLWRIAPPSKVAIWTLGGAHGASLHLEAGAEVDERIGRIGDRIGDRLGGLLERDDLLPELGEDVTTPSADLDVRLASMTVLAVVGVAFALLARSSGAAGVRDATTVAGVGAVVYGAGVAALVSGSSASLGFDARIVRAGVEASMSPLAAGGGALVSGAIFAFIGALCAPGVMSSIPASWRAVGAGLRTGAGVAAAAAVVCLIVLGFAQRPGTGGAAIDASLLALGAVVLGVNVVAAAIVLAHGATLQVSLDAGPLSEWTRVGYSASGSRSPSPARFLFLIVPVLAGIVAGRAMRSRVSSRDVPKVAAVFGVLWGVALAVCAFVLRVDVLSSFSLGSLEAGGGAAINPLVALVVGVVWGGVTSYIGMVSVRQAPHEPADIGPSGSYSHPRGRPSEALEVSAQPPHAPNRRCGSCGAAVPEGDRFCGACGRLV